MPEEKNNIYSKKREKCTINEVCPSEVQDLLPHLECFHPARDVCELTLLDVRTPPEYSACHLEGAINLDIRSPCFKEQVSRLDQKKIYLIYCRTGVRSRLAAELMSDMGFRKLYNLNGGINRWQREGFAVVKPRDNDPK